MLDEFQSRYLALLQNSPYIKSVARSGRQIVNIAYYCYNVQVGTAALPLLENVPQTGIIETQADSDFAVNYMSSVLRQSTGAVNFTGNVTLQIKDLATGKSFFSAPCVMPLVTGAGGVPFVLPAPRVINPNSTIAVTVNSRATGTIYDSLFLALHGVRIYYS